MNKKGQIYILAAIILIMVLSGFTTTGNYIKQENINGNFEKISENYELESSRLINNLLMNKDMIINEAFNNFTILFTAYSKSQNPSYGIVYVLSFKDKESYRKIQIGNYLNKPLLIDTDGNYKTQEYESILGCFDEIPVALQYEGLNINSDLKQEHIKACIKIIEFKANIMIGIKDSKGEITYDDKDIIWYNMNITEDKPQIMIINHFEKGKQRKVYIGGEGFIPFIPFKDN